MYWTAVPCVHFTHGVITGCSAMEPAIRRMSISHSGVLVIVRMQLADAQHGLCSSDLAREEQPCWRVAAGDRRETCERCMAHV